MKLQGIVRTIGGAALSGKEVTLKKTSDDTTVTTATSDANGLWSITLDYNPAGRLYWTYTDGATTRRGGSSTWGMAGPNALYDYAYVAQGLGDGVLSGMAISATGTRQVSVASGQAVVKGVIVSAAGANSPATAGSANATGSTRIDTLVLEVTRIGQTEEGKAVLKIVEGTTVKPSLTQTSSLWQYPLADLSLANGGTSYTVSLDRRTTFQAASGLAHAALQTAVARRDAGTPVSITATGLADVAAANVNLTLTSGNLYDLTLDAAVYVTPGTNADVSIQPYIDTANGDTITTSGLTSLTVPAGATLTGVDGAGQTITGGFRLMKSGAGSATYDAFTVTLRARPRW